jgi:hypothetical protein
MLPDYVARNRVYWDEVNAPQFAESGARDWAQEAISWGTFGVPADELHAPPRDVSGMDGSSSAVGPPTSAPGWRAAGAPISAACRRRLDSTKAEMSCLNSVFSISTSNSR